MRTTLSENAIARTKTVLRQVEAGHQPAESVKEVPAKLRKKAVSDEDAGQIVLFG